ncbi:unnamed protein product [Cylindrotheca closterium]|uniref:Uncharacterized protein n=1 Tax=Cylindrotheca closterium TaxID=2856 RepID=A0AAD2FHE8_9STRA|nr:unnamed protein product [Cylindrotheca closterium]
MPEYPSGSEAEDTRCTDQDIDFLSYNLTQKRNWLLHRKISGIKKDSPCNLVEGIFDAITSSEDIPPIVEDLFLEANLCQVKDVVIGWHACISQIMSITENPTDTAAEIGRERKGPNPKVENNLGLNYPDLVREHGPLRPLSELDFKGEALIQLLEKKFSSGTREENWAYNAYYKDKLYRNVLRDAKQSFLSSINEELSSSEPATLKILQAIDHKIKEGATKGGKTRIEDEMICNTNSNFVRYKDIETAHRHLSTRNNLITGIVVENARYFVLVGLNWEEERYYQIEPDMYHLSLCGADYFTWRICSDNEVKNNLEKIRVPKSTHYFLMLPLLDDISNKGDRAIGCEMRRTDTNVYDCKRSVSSKDKSAAYESCR